MNLKRMVILGALIVGISSGYSASANTINVAATDDIFLAGLTSVPSGFPYNSGAPGEGAGTLPKSIGVYSGEVITISAAGEVSCCLGGNPFNGPDGGGLGGNTSISPGYGNVAAIPSSDGIPQLALLGVFNGPVAPGTQSWAPFLIGSSDTITVSSGETRLYFGFADALGFQDPPGYYNDNTGSLSVTTSVPEVSTWAMLLLGFAGLGFAGYRQRRAASVA